MTSQQPEPKPSQQPEPDQSAARIQHPTTAVLIGAALGGTARAFVAWLLERLISS